jgi:FixJ family two-component response regulator
MEAGTFTSGQEIIDLVDSLPPPRIDCIVLDIQMPNLNGLEVQERLVKSHSRIPVIFITAHDEVGMREQTLAAGAVGFLRKPFSDELLIETLRETLERGGENEDG